MHIKASPANMRCIHRVIIVSWTWIINDGCQGTGEEGGKDPAWVWGLARGEDHLMGKDGPAIQSADCHDCEPRNPHRVTGFARKI